MPHSAGAKGKTSRGPGRRPVSGPGSVLLVGMKSLGLGQVGQAVQFGGKVHRAPRTAADVYLTSLAAGARPVTSLATQSSQRENAENAKASVAPGATRLKPPLAG